MKGLDHYEAWGCDGEHVVLAPTGTERPENCPHCGRWGSLALLGPVVIHDVAQG